MSYIETIPPSASSGEVREMYSRQQASWGFVPNYAKVFSHRPEVLKRWAGLLSAIRSSSDTRRFELVTFAAAHALKNSYCSLAHGQALTEFLDTDEIRELALTHECDSLSEAEKAMMSFARKVALDAASVTSEDAEDLRSHGFSDEEVFDIAATAAARSFFTKILDALGTEADTAMNRMERSLREALVVGRPIGTDQLEWVSESAMGRTPARTGPGSLE